MPSGNMTLPSPSGFEAGIQSGPCGSELSTIANGSKPAPHVCHEGTRCFFVRRCTMEMRTCNHPAEPKSKHSRSTPPPSRTPPICCAAFELADEGFLRMSRGNVPSGHQRRVVLQKSLPWYHKRVEGTVPADYSPQRHQTIGKLLDSRDRSLRKGPSPNLSHVSPG